MRQISRMESQRTRLIEDLEKSDDAMKKLAIEKTILDIDNKIMHGVAKISLNSESMMNAVINFLNNWSEKNKVDIGFIEERSLLKTSTKTRDKIIKLIQEDTKNKNGIVREF